MRGSVSRAEKQVLRRAGQVPERLAGGAVFSGTLFVRLDLVLVVLPRNVLTRSE